MLEVVSFSDVSEYQDDADLPVALDAVSSRRGGFLHGTKIATTSGWKLIERIAAGDLVRTLDHGFKEVRRVSTSWVNIPAGERRSAHLPIFVPARAAYNGRAVWLMPEQGVALDRGKLDLTDQGVSVVPARLLDGACRLSSQSPGSSFEVTTLFFDQDEVIYIEGGLQAYCPSGRFSRTSGQAKEYAVADEDAATALVGALAASGEISALANPLGALPAPIPTDPIFPIRPAAGIRRPGRPGRPSAPVLFLRPEWQTAPAVQ